jgi:glycosyltransferase involved in cell wall biosynthesis
MKSSNMGEKPNNVNAHQTVAFSWNGLPQYAARLIKASIGEIPYKVNVVGSLPNVPIKGMDEALGQKIHWVDAAKPTSWSALGLPVPSVYFQSGWAYPAFNALGNEVRASGGKVALLCDNNLRNDWRQLLGSVAFRMLYRRKFDAWFTPGASGEILARRYGMKQNQIWKGMYGADPTIFTPGPALSQRPKTLLFVGQYIDRKNCIGLAQAFASVACDYPGWELHMYGSGPLQGQIPTHPAIHVHPFVQPVQLGGVYRQSRIFCLPSHKEAWGLVVHEAALSGCMLALSQTIGAAADFVGKTNAITYPSRSVPAIAAAIAALMDKSDVELDSAGLESSALAASHGPAAFARSANEITAKLLPQTK